MGDELNNENSKFGLNQKQLQQILHAIQSFPLIEKVIIFGSRATGTNRPGSDIDLQVFTKAITFSIVNRLASALDDLPLPFLIDVVNYQTINNTALKENIDTKGKVLFERKLNCV